MSKLSFFLGLALLRPCLAAPIVVTDGVSRGDVNSFPYENVTTSVRYQQIFDASFFLARGITGPVLLTDLFYDSVLGNLQPTGVYSAVVSNVQITLSTTSRTNSTMSTTFANNVGADATVVRSGALTLSSAGAAYDTGISLTPFLYNPLAGNLLLDVSNFGAGATVPGAGFTAGGLSGVQNSRRVFSSDGGVNNSTGSIQGFALSTRFVFQDAASAGAPEMDPTGAMLPIFSALTLLVVSRHRVTRLRKDTGLRRR